MNWNEQAEQRRRRYIRLCEAKQLCVLAGDRVAVRLLDDCVRRARERLQYAEKMDRIGPRIWSPGVATFATPDNRPDNRAATGDNRHG